MPRPYDTHHNQDTAAGAPTHLMQDHTERGSGKQNEEELEIRTLGAEA